MINQQNRKNKCGINVYDINRSASQQKLETILLFNNIPIGLIKLTNKFFNE